MHCQCRAGADLSLRPGVKGRGDCLLQPRPAEVREPRSRLPEQTTAGHQAGEPPYGQAVQPREWFTVSVRTAIEVCKHVIAGDVVQYRMNNEIGAIVKK